MSSLSSNETDDGMHSQIVLDWIRQTAFVQRHMIEGPPLKVHLFCGSINDLHDRLSKKLILCIFPVGRMNYTPYLDEFGRIFNHVELMWVDFRDVICFWKFCNNVVLIVNYQMCAAVQPV